VITSDDTVDLASVMVTTMEPQMARLEGYAPASTLYADVKVKNENALKLLGSIFIHGISSDINLPNVGDNYFLNEVYAILAAQAFLSEPLTDGHVICISAKHTNPVVVLSAGFAIALAAAGVHMLENKPIIATGILDLTTGAGLFSMELGDTDRKIPYLDSLKSKYNTLVGYPSAI